jgi:hypothetical protein
LSTSPLSAAGGVEVVWPGGRVTVVAELGPLTRAVIGIVRDGGDHRGFAKRVCRACVEDLDVDGAAISLLTATQSRVTLSATDAIASNLEDLQFTLGEGACVEAAVDGRPVLVPDIHDHLLTSRWPMFAAAVVEQTGVRALFALPLQLGTINVGVLDLYRATPGPLRGDELRDVVAAADTTTVILLGVPAQAGDDPSDEQHIAGRTPDGRPAAADGGEVDRVDGACWDGLPDIRAEVHQATGMILVQLGIPADEAFLRLRAHAFVTYRPLADVARDVVARRLVFTQDTD